LKPAASVLMASTKYGVRPDGANPSGGSDSRGRYHRRVAETDGRPLAERLEEIGAQLAWVRDYL
jgi:hypothetical protein